ncbi:hypothetical protein ACFFWD_43650 [Bradyrhizobium erythrophlei]|uniref:hypothetical protein n=1 Tax=Bradyrhizobium erythrophlei TaxID=1437360 RepID=UPI0035E7BE2E
MAVLDGNLANARGWKQSTPSSAAAIKVGLRSTLNFQGDNADHRGNPGANHPWPPGEPSRASPMGNARDLSITSVFISFER